MAALVGIAMISAGCGGGGSASEARPEGNVLTRAQFVSAANALCMTEEKRRNKIVETAYKELPPGKSWSAAEQGELVLVAIGPIEEMIQNVRALRPPPQDDAKVRDIANAFEASLTQVHEEPQTGVSGSAFTKADKLAAAYGLTKCQI